MYLYNNVSGSLVQKFDVSGFEIRRIRANCDGTCLAIVDSNSKVFIYDLHAILKGINSETEINEASYHIDTISRFKAEIVDVLFSHHDRDLMYVLSKDQSVNLCTLKGNVLKTIALSQSPQCMAIDNLDSLVVVGCETGEICVVSLAPGNAGEEEGFSKPSQNLLTNMSVLTMNKLALRNSNPKVSTIQLHGKRVNALCYVTEEQRFMSAGDDCCIYSFNAEGKTLSVVKNLKTPYCHLSVIGRHLVQESTTAGAKKQKQRAKVFKAFSKVINRAESPSEVVCIGRSKRISKPVNRSNSVKQLLAYISCQLGNKADEETAESKIVEPAELLSLRKENEKLKTVNSKLLEVCVMLEDQPMADNN